MKIQKVLSKLFSTECKYRSYEGGVIIFVVGECEISAFEDYIAVISDKGYGHCSVIHYCEIKDIEITDDKVTFVLKDGGYKFEDGDEFEIGRK